MKSTVMPVILLAALRVFSQTHPAPRHLEEIAFDRDRKVLIVHGGIEPDITGGNIKQPTNTLEWNGEGWTDIPSAAPVGIAGHALIYNEKENKVFLIGGQIKQPDDGSSLGVWVWKEGSWNQVSTECPLRSIEATYDRFNNRILIYGKPYSKNNNSPGANTWQLWEYKDTIWKKITDKGPDLAASLSRYEIAFDAKRRTLIVPQWEDKKLVIWEWQNEKWEKIGCTGQCPDVKYYFTMAYSPEGSATYLFGGTKENGMNSGDFWKWDGRNWAKITTTQMPDIRAGATLEYGNKALYLYGGIAGWGITNELWRWRNGSWTLINLEYALSAERKANELQKLIKGNPRNAELYHSYGNTMKYLMKETELTEAYEKAASLDADNYNYLFDLVQTLYTQNKGTEAEKYIAGAVNSSGKARNFYSQLGGKLLSIKKYQEGIQCYQKANEIEPRGGDFYNVACAYALTQNKDKAFDALNKAADLGYNSKQNFEGDTDLASLKSDERWKSLSQKLVSALPPEDLGKPYKRAHHEMVYDEANKSVLMIGGSTPLNGGQSFKFFNDIWKYNNTGWSKVANAGDERSGIRLAYDTKRNKLYSYGGFTANNQSSGQLRVLENGEWKILSDIPEMIGAEPGFVYDASRDKFIAFGGSAGRGLVNSTTWEWDGTSWKKFEGKSPDGRQAFVMVYDSKRKKTILFGGMGTSPKEKFGDTWEFDGTTWTKVAESGPEPRMSPGYSYDSKRGMLIIFGGSGKEVIKGDTWGWDGKEWKKLADTGPAPRMMGYMAYDKDRDRIVLFGGRFDWPNDADDTWEWDGKQWSEIK